MKKDSLGLVKKNTGSMKDKLPSNIAPLYPTKMFAIQFIDRMLGLDLKEYYEEYNLRELLCLPKAQK